MRTPLNLDEDLIAYLHQTTGLKEKSALVHEALLALRAREVPRRLAKMGGMDAHAKAAPRNSGRKTSAYQQLPSKWVSVQICKEINSAHLPRQNCALR